MRRSARTRSSKAAPRRERMRAVAPRRTARVASSLGDCQSESSNRRRMSASVAFRSSSPATPYHAQARPSPGSHRRTRRASSSMIFKASTTASARPVRTIASSSEVAMKPPLRTTSRRQVPATQGASVRGLTAGRSATERTLSSRRALARSMRRSAARSMVRPARASRKIATASRRTVIRVSMGRQPWLV